MAGGEGEGEGKEREREGKVEEEREQEQEDGCPGGEAKAGERGEGGRMSESSMWEGERSRPGEEKTGERDEKAGGKLNELYILDEKRVAVQQLTPMEDFNETCTALLSRDNEAMLQIMDTKVHARTGARQTVFRRRLRFKRMPNLIQSEVPLAFSFVQESSKSASQEQPQMSDNSHHPFKGSNGVNEKSVCVETSKLGFEPHAQQAKCLENPGEPDVLHSEINSYAAVTDFGVLSNISGTKRQRQNGDSFPFRERKKGTKAAEGSGLPLDPKSALMDAFRLSDPEISPPLETTELFVDQNYQSLVKQSETRGVQPSERHILFSSTINNHTEHKLLLENSRKQPDYSQLVHKYLSPIVAGLPLIGQAIAAASKDGLMIRVLIVGGGACTLPIFLYHHFPFHIQVVELDRVVVELAKRHFGLVVDKRLAIHIGDATDFMTSLADEVVDMSLGESKLMELWRDIAVIAEEAGDGKSVVLSSSGDGCSTGTSMSNRSMSHSYTGDSDSSNSRTSCSGSTESQEREAAESTSPSSEDSDDVDDESLKKTQNIQCPEEHWERNGEGGDTVRELTAYEGGTRQSLNSPSPSLRHKQQAGASPTSDLQPGKVETMDAETLPILPQTRDGGGERATSGREGQSISRCGRETRTGGRGGIDFADSNKDSEDPRVHFLVIDVDASDGRLNLSAPPPEFLNPKFLLASRLALHPDGLLAINVVPHAKEEYSEFVYRLKTLYAEVYESNVESDVNFVLFALPRPSKPDLGSIGGVASSQLTELMELYKKIRKL